MNHHNPQIDHSPPDRVADALRLVFGDLPTSNREDQLQAVLAGVRLGEMSLDGLLEARREDRLVGAVFTQVQPGQTGLVWLPRLLGHDEPATTARALLEAACGLLADHHVRMAQAVLETVTAADASLLRHGGFRHLAELLYLVCLEEEFPRREPLGDRAGELSFEPHDPADQDRLIQLVNATYQDTRDCPELNGVRRTEDVLAGYRATGEFDPARWLIVRHANRDVGCLLLADHPAQNNWELVYMGLVVSARGQGWGTQIARHALWLTGRVGRPQLVVAVDGANWPAVNMYESVGFRRWDTRQIYVKELIP